MPRDPIRLLRCSLAARDIDPNHAVPVLEITVAPYGNPDRLGAAVQRFIGEAPVVVGFDVERIELDRLRVISNRVVAVALCDVRNASKAALFVDRRVFASMQSTVASRDRPSRESNSEGRGGAASPLAKPKPLFALPMHSMKRVQPPPA